MEAKKHPQADLTKKSGLFLNIGLVVSLALVVTAFEWRFYDDGALRDLGSVNEDFEAYGHPRLIMPVLSECARFLLRHRPTKQALFVRGRPSITSPSGA